MNKKDIIEKIGKTDTALAGILTIACEDYHKKQGGDIYAWGYIQGMCGALERLGVITVEEKMVLFKGV